MHEMRVLAEYNFDLPKRCKEVAAQGKNYYK